MKSFGEKQKKFDDKLYKEMEEEQKKFNDKLYKEMEEKLTAKVTKLTEYEGYFHGRCEGNIKIDLKNSLKLEKTPTEESSKIITRDPRLMKLLERAVSR